MPTTAPLNSSILPSDDRITVIFSTASWGFSITEEETDPDDPMVEFVDKTYLSEEFRCFTCGLALIGRREVDAAKLPEEFYERDTREREFEPEYGND